VLVDMEGYSVEETAAILECAPGTVKSRCSRGRKRLAPLLGDLAGEGAPGNRSTSSRVPSTAPEPGAGSPAAANAPPSRPEPDHPGEQPNHPDDRPRPPTRR